MRQFKFAHHWFPDFKGRYDSQLPLQFSFRQGMALFYFGRMFTAADLFDLSQTEHAKIFDGCEYAWDVLKRIRSYVAEHVHRELRNRCEGVAYVGEQVFIGEGTIVEDGAMIKGPAIIG